MIINLFTPEVQENKFSGGIYCIFKYAQGLVERGHEVNVIASYGSSRPKWIVYNGNFLVPKAPKIKLGRGIKETIKKNVEYFDYLTFKAKSLDIKNLLSDRLLLNNPQVIPKADVSIATAWSTAALVAKVGTGRKYYFMQHYESVFFDDNSYEGLIVESTYHLPLVKIANSTWLKGKIEDYLQNQEIVNLVTNAVDTNVYKCQSSIRKLSMSEKDINIISYGGRGVKWKGFNEMALAMRLVKEELSDWNIQWNVYGESELLPDNNICNYNSLGFLNPNELSEAYCQNDILLSASWYESYPLFPIEAMACGLAVITTKQGTEDYAVDGYNANIVKEKNINSIAEGIKDLIVNSEKRKLYGINGIKTAKEQNWESSVTKMLNVINA
ncbi:glycosyltransferase family 4 protein [Hafnia alvei]|uniref:Spore coat protein SA n=1 Tax=Hafnia alvei TaxID=569 RepID=A0A172X0L5_HAFAL|nr:glycosyltransferase family 4 protein [Hafnia alvei]ANF30174.1 spore coat protein SA [Hafnia alvei]TBM13615.1 glycosyltransferase [Hafnia alvei]